MKRIENYFFKDMGVLLGRSIRHIFRSTDTRITVTIIPIALMLLFAYAFGGAMLVLEEILTAITGKKKKK